MQIAKVQATNLKGRTFSYELSPAVAIVGDNFTGKTSIIDAIRLGLIGYIPELGNTNAATYQLASGQDMTVMLTLSNGQQIGVTAWLDKTAKVARKIYPSLVDSSPITEESLDNIPLLNAAAYFAMSERERYDYVFGVAKLPEEFSIASIIAECERISFEEEHTEAIVLAKQGVITSLMKIAERVEITVQQFLTFSVEKMKESFTSWNARAKDTQGAVRVMAELKNREAAQGATARELAEEEKKARVECENAYKAQIELNTKVKEARDYQERKKHADALRRAVTTDTDSELKMLQKNIDEASAMLKKVTEPKLTEEAIAKVREQLGLEQARRSVKLQLMEGQKKELDELAAYKECPYCKTKSARWKDTAERILTDAIKKMDAEIKTADSVIGGLKTKLQAGEESLFVFRGDVAHNKEIAGRIAGWQQAIDSLAARREGWKASLDKAEKAVGAEIQPPTETELREAEEAYAARERALGLATDRLRAADNLEHELKRGAQAQLEHETAKATVRVIKAVRETLEQKKEALVEQVFNDLLAVANGIVGGLLPTALAFHEGEVGRWNGHRWISNKTFTGAEQALTFVAIATALSQSSPIKLLIFDELGRLDEQNVSRLLGTLYAAKDFGWIDQFIVSGAVPAPKQSAAFANEFGKLQIIDLNNEHKHSNATLS